MRRGFTAIELLITLFVAAMALASGYQLYAAIMKEDGNTRMESTIAKLAQENVRRYSSSVTAPCTASTPLNNSSVTVPDITNVRVTVKIDCPNPQLPNISRVTATVTYSTPQKTLTHAAYATPGGP